MKILVRMLLFVAVFAAIVPAIANDLSDAEIKKILIEQSIRSHSGACPCPYNVMKNGHRCGGNSA